jgi:GNAT superfamily N-acetyltransferase
MNNSRPDYSIRAFRPPDAGAVAALFSAYMHEVFGMASAMTSEVLLRDGQGSRFSLVVAVGSDDEPVGFAAWRDAYDLHHTVSGGEIPDLFVAPAHRGRALSVRLVAAVARTIEVRGGLYLKGEVLLDDPRRLRLLRRVTVGFPGESVYVSGRAFRRLVEMLSADRKTLLRGLPSPAASREP